jgi:hypothetical protein
VSCTLTQQKSSIRISSALAGAYQRDPSNSDERFVDYFGSTDEIVTSGGSNDSGLFEASLSDERFLPFEGSGAISTWTLALPTAFPSFDHMTISDLLFQMRLTAREGGGLLGSKATQELKILLASPSALPLLLSLRFDFPGEWSTFVNSTANFIFTLRRDHFPYMTQNSKISVDQMVLYAPSQAATSTVLQRTLTDPLDWSGSALNNDLNGAKAASSLSFSGDNDVLTRSSESQVFLIIGYHLT